MQKKKCIHLWLTCFMWLVKNKIKINIEKYKNKQLLCKDTHLTSQNVCHHCYIERSGSTNCRGRWKHRSTTPQHHVTRCGQMIWSAHAQMLNCCRMHLALMHPALRLLSVSDIFSFHSLLMLLHCLNATSLLPFSPFLSF